MACQPATTIVVVVHTCAPTLKVQSDHYYIYNLTCVAPSTNGHAMHRNGGALCHFVLDEALPLLGEQNKFYAFNKLERAYQGLANGQADFFFKVSSEHAAVQAPDDLL